MEEGFIIDMVMNTIGDDKCTEKIMELPDGELTLNNAIYASAGKLSWQMHIYKIAQQ